jgi:transposase
MRGKQSRDEGLFTYVRLEDLVPKDHILRAIDRWIDITCIEEKTRALYSHTGRPQWIRKF